MDLDSYLRGIRTRLINVHHDLIGTIKLDEKQLALRPGPGSWSIREIIEHVGLTSHFLLIIIDKSAAKARRRSSPEALAAAKEHLPDPDRLEIIGRHKSFPWSRPEHMEPSGTAPPEEITDTLTSQLTRCLVHLDALRDGAGLLHTTRMTVADLGRLNTYEYIDFLARHASRHLEQIAKIRAGARV